MNRYARAKLTLLLDYAQSRDLLQDEQGSDKEIYAAFFVRMQQQLLDPHVHGANWRGRLLAGLEQDLREQGIAGPLPFSGRVSDLNILANVILNAAPNDNEAFKLVRKLATYASPPLQEVLFSAYGHEAQNQEREQLHWAAKRDRSLSRQGEILTVRQRKTIAEKDSQVHNLVQTVMRQMNVPYSEALRLILD